MLHLPIGLFVGIALYETLAAMRKRPAAPHSLVFLAALSGALAACSGWVLREEPGYGGDLVEWHRWLGVATATCGVIAWLLHAVRRTTAYRQTLAVTVVVLLPAAHLGGSMTHGEDFLLEPFQEQGTPEPALDVVETLDPAAVTASYTEHVAPILAARCTNCHGARKHKAKLRLDTPEHILAGGAGGPALVPGDPEGSELFFRMGLPLDDEDHMPPEGKPQPAPAELALIETWIAAGAPMEGSFELGAGGALPAPVGIDEPVALDEPEVAALEPAPAGALAALRERLVHVAPVSQGAPELWIDFAAPAADIADGDATRLLEPVREQVAELSLARTGISDEFLAFAAGLPSLRRLDVRDTEVGDTGLYRLGPHPTLEELVLVRTRLSDAAVELLLGLPSLKKVWVWGVRSLPGRRRAPAGRAPRARGRRG